MGDSFTEGIGLPFDQTFVGMVSNSFPDLRIANLGVVSYSPSIYLSKLKELYKQGYRFKHVIVFIDIADVYDEANAYDLHHDSVVVDKGEIYPLTGLRLVRRIASRNFPLTGEAWGHLRKLLHDKQPQASAPIVVSTTAGPSPKPTIKSVAQVSASVPTGTTPAPLSSQGEKPPEQAEAPFLQNIYDGIYLKGYPKSEWTYNTHSRHYGPTGVIGNLEKMQREMKALHTLVSEHGATLSVGVYPWPGQILYDVIDSLHVQIWRDFCSSRCLHFYNAFPAFFELSERLGKEAVVNQYYFSGDAHFNALGNKIIAETIVRQGIR